MLFLAFTVFTALTTLTKYVFAKDEMGGAMYKLNLRQAKVEEDARIRQKYGSRLMRQMYEEIIESAKKGEMNYAVEFKGCEHIDLHIDHNTCHLIVEDVFAFILRKFPDSDINYNVDTRLYVVSWA
jgi:hypothetical protein